MNDFEPIYSTAAQKKLHKAIAEANQRRYPVTYKNGNGYRGKAYKRPAKPASDIEAGVIFVLGIALGIAVATVLRGF